MLTPVLIARLEERLLQWQKVLQWDVDVARGAAHVLSWQGAKAVRPRFVVLAYEAESGDTGLPPLRVLDAALAVEFIHAYSLVHDDLPCMDNADWRRGRPTLHRLQNEAMAVLIGDALLTGAFEILGSLVAERQMPAQSVALLARAAGGAGMIAGQAEDIRPSQQRSWEDLERGHRCKTGALFGASLALGALAAGAVNKVEHYQSWGSDFGVHFQVMDDLLDALTLVSSSGKDSRDAERDRANAVSLKGFDGARRAATGGGEALAEYWPSDATRPQIQALLTELAARVPA